MELNKKQERTISEVNPSIFRRFPFSPKRKGSTTFSGRFQSRFIGQGYEFYGLREYQLGDDARKIHWKHYAKTDELNIREDVIESNMRMWVVQDLSASMDFGEKPVLVKGFFAFIEHLLREGGNSIGAIGFSDKVHLFQRPTMISLNARKIQTLLQSKKTQEARGTNISPACALLSKHAQPGDIVFIVSDFFLDEDLEKRLSSLALEQEVIPVVIRDPREYETMDNIRASFRDMEISRSPVILSGAGLAHYDEVLCDIYSRLRLDSLWINGTSYSDSMKIISEWLYRRNKS